jgi:iron complex outermembrane receptor protein
MPKYRRDQRQTNAVQYIASHVRSGALTRIVAASLMSVVLLAPHPASAQTTTASTEKSKSDSALAEIVVTGSLIPQVRAETSTPITVITAVDIEAKGFATVAEALQHTSFATGSVQGAGTSTAFTQGTNTVSFFGLNPGYVKYLIDGRPLGDYPALYNGTDIIPSISGLPAVLIDHIDILPGGQSSIYGSDAIAGVVNVVLKKTMDGALADVRYGWTGQGGGVSKRIAVADGFNFSTFNVLVGAQFEKVEPIWGYKRSLTDSFFANGSSPQTAERDFLINGLFGPAGDGRNTYYFEDPANCAKVAGLFGDSVGLRTRANRGQYCGTTKSGFFTIANGTKTTQGYLHANDDINEHVQIFTDVLLEREIVSFGTGTVFYSTQDDSTGPFGYFEDPNVTTNDYLNVQHIFSPEEAGGLNNTLDKNINDSIRATIGVLGSIGSTHWTYAADMSYMQHKLAEKFQLGFTDKINNFFAPIFGPNLGFDPILGTNIYSPNYAAFYTPLTPAQYASFTGTATSNSRTEESLARAQLTNTALFSLPGGNAGLALVVEGGDQGWDYNPDPNFLDGQAYLFSATPGSGHRSRYAATGELRMPIVSMLTVDASVRYDDYRVANQNVDKGTYNLGVEFRPIPSLLFRGRYGTAFKAPTLSDEFQGPSGFFVLANDYYACAKEGFAPGDSNCPQFNESIAGKVAGNPALKPITAKVSDLGIAWTPLGHGTITADLLHWKISNEVVQQPFDQLLRTDSACLLGQLDITSPTCVQAIAQVTRNANGQVTLVSTPKVNLSDETLTVFALGLNYTLSTSGAGTFIFEGSYSNTLKHTFVQFPGDPEHNFLEDPFFSTDFKTKENLAVTWHLAKFGTTIYVEHYGRTPNYLAALTPQDYATPGAGRLSTWTLANLSANYELAPGLVVAAIVNNLFDKQPPVDNSYPGIINQPYNTQDYNPYGRSFFLQATYKFGRR